MTLLLGDILVISSAETISKHSPPSSSSSSTSSSLIELGNEEEGKVKRGEKSRAAEIVVGDETGSIIFTAQSGDQIDTVLALGRAGHPFTVKNAYTELTNGENCLRLLVDTFFGEIAPCQNSELLLQPTHLNTKNNLSKIKYERI